MIFAISFALAAAAPVAPASPASDGRKAQVEAAAQSWGLCLTGKAAMRGSLDQAIIDDVLKSCAASETALEAALARTMSAEEARAKMAKTREAVRASFLRAGAAPK